MKRSRLILSVGVIVSVLAGMAVAVNIDLVTVGNPGNAADTRTMSDGTIGYGAVAYTYNIGKYEVTAGQYCEFLNKVAATDTYGLYNAGMAGIQSGSGISRSGSPDSYTYTVKSAFANRPVNYVSYWDACRFTNWLSNGQPTGVQGPNTTERGTYTLDGYSGEDGRTIHRNPDSTWAVTSEDEWYKAAYYKGGSTNAGYWDYPTRSNTAPGRDLNDASGNNANYCYYDAPSDPYPIQSPYYTTVAGEFQNSASPYGTFDQGGNVWEWNEAIVIQEATYALRGARGGSFYYLSSGDVLLASFRNHGGPSYDFNTCGFRVSYVPEPTTLTLLALAGIGVVARRRRR